VGRLVWTERDIGYVAGLYEGEGSCGRKQNRSRKHGFTRMHKSYNFQIMIQMTDVEPLQKVAEIMGFGYVNGPYFRKKRKPYYSYSVSNIKDVQLFLGTIFQDLSPRRQEQACACLGDDFAYEMGL
jgi:hypothetical protein